MCALMVFRNAPNAVDPGAHFANISAARSSADLRYTGDVGPSRAPERSIVGEVRCVRRVGSPATTLPTVEFVRPSGRSDGVAPAQMGLICIALVRGSGEPSCRYGVPSPALRAVCRLPGSCARWSLIRTVVRTDSCGWVSVESEQACDHGVRDERSVAFRGPSSA